MIIFELIWMEYGLLKTSVSIMLFVVATIMVLASHRIPVNVLKVGQVMIARYRCVNRNAFTMVTALFQTLVHVKRDGVGKIAPSRYAHKSATMVVCASPQTHVNVTDGKIVGVMDKLKVVFHYFKRRMAAPS